MRDHRRVRNSNMQGNKMLRERGKLMRGREK